MFAAEAEQWNATKETMAKFVVLLDCSSQRASIN